MRSFLGSIAFVAILGGCSSPSDRALDPSATSVASEVVASTSEVPAPTATPRSGSSSSPGAEPTAASTAPTTSLATATAEAIATPVPTDVPTATSTVEPTVTPVATATLEAPATTATVAPTTPVPTASPPPAPVAVEIMIQGFGYQPQSVEVDRGSTVTWINLDAVQHDADDGDGSWDGPLLDEGGTWSHTFGTSGKFLVTCSIHPYMQSLITVR